MVKIFNSDTKLHYTKQNRSAFNTDANIALSGMPKLMNNFSENLLSIVLKKTLTKMFNMHI
jgi:hypothetical protein